MLLENCITFEKLGYLKNCVTLEKLFYNENFVTVRESFVLGCVTVKICVGARYCKVLRYFEKFCRIILRNLT